MKNVYLVSGVRSPFAKAGADLKSVHAAELGRFVVSELLNRTNVPLTELGPMVNEVVIGNTGTPSDTANIARVIALRAGLPLSTSAYSVHRNCASALEAIAQCVVKIRAGEGDLYIGGGTESMSQIPLMYNSKAVAFFETLSKAKSTGDKLGAFAKIPVQDFLKPRVGIVEGLTDPFCGLNMGQTAEVLAKEFHISRDEQDQFALQSHEKAIAAAEAGRFQDEVAVMPLPPKYEKALALDVGPRKGQTLQALGKLKPYFDRKFGTVTVGNACPITDGAAAVILASDEGLKKLGNPKPLAKVVSFAFAGLDPKRMGLGPVYSSFLALKKANLKLSDMGVVEINEAFAAQVIACLKAFSSQEFCKSHLGLDQALGEVKSENLNPNGGAIALGHPVGATGARIALTAALEMKRRSSKYALATLCIGGGQGGAIVLENLS